MTVVLTCIAVAYIAFSAICLIAAIAAYFDIGIGIGRKNKTNTKG